MATLSALISGTGSGVVLLFSFSFSLSLFDVLVWL